MSASSPMQPPPPQPPSQGGGRWTPQARKRARQFTLLHKPWLHSTGPRTPQGKARVAANGRKRQHYAQSHRQLRAQVAEVDGLIRELAALRRSLAEAG